jgi:hypothetical protein
MSVDFRLKPEGDDLIDTVKGTKKAIQIRPDPETARQRAPDARFERVRSRRNNRASDLRRRAPDRELERDEL